MLKIYSVQFHEKYHLVSPRRSVSHLSGCLRPHFLVSRSTTHPPVRRCSSISSLSYFYVHVRIPLTCYDIPLGTGYSFFNTIRNYSIRVASGTISTGLNTDNCALENYVRRNGFIVDDPSSN